MGAVDYSNIVLINGNENDAFREAKEEMRDYNGHQEGYSGDIQTATGFWMPKKHPKFGTKAFNKWEEKEMEEMSKGDCICVEITGKKLKEWKERKGFKNRRKIRGFYFFGLGRC